nr:hypothetical protein [Leptosphaeria biglobosa chrysovirus 1]
MAATFNSVFEHMKEVSNNVAHERIARKAMYSEEEGVTVVDLLAVEARAIKTSEMNVLSGCSMPMKFTRKGMDKDGLNIDITSVAQGNTVLGVKTLTNSSCVKIDYKMDICWELSAKRTEPVYSSRDAPSMHSDTILRSRITGACANLGKSSMSGLSVTHAMERITQKSDMRHMMCKMYLMLMDLTLATTSKVETRRVAKQFTRFLLSRGSDSRRLGSVMSKAVVIDGDMLTDEEIELACLGAMEYPSVKFSADNVYNMISMCADDMLIITSDGRQQRMKMNWVPDSMYRTIVSFCCKMGCLDDWFEVASMMRGRPHLMREVMRRTTERVVHMGIPTSRSCTRAFGMIGKRTSIPRTYPGYLSTSVNLVADYLLGQVLHNSTASFVELTGGYGKLMCMGNPATDSLYQSLLRDYGVSTMSSRTNGLLSMWCQVLEIPIFGWSSPDGWKEYVVSLADEMRNGADVPIPQLTFESAYISAENTTWGATRGWDGLDDNRIAGHTNGPNDRDESVRKTAAFLWQMGVRKERPRIFANCDKKGEDILRSSDYKFMSASEGSYRMTWVRYTAADGLGGRVDETEKEATSIVETFFRGTKCSVIYVAEKGWIVKTYQNPDVKGVAESMGITGSGVAQKKDVGFASEDEEIGEEKVPEEEELMAPITYGGSPADKEKENFKALIGKYRPRTAVVKSRNGWREVNNFKEGDTVRFEKVKVPGDGNCGVYAMVKGLEAMNAITGVESDRAIAEMRERLDEKDWHTHVDLGRVAMEIGCRLQVFESGTNRLHEFGDEDAVGVISIVHSDGHYDGMRLSDTGESEFKIKYVDRSSEPASNQLEKIKEVKAMLPVGRW